MSGSDDVRDTFVSWLNNAHAMENQLIAVLQSHLGDSRYPPVAQQRFSQHLSETRTHADRIAQCVDMMGASTSSFKSTVASLVGSVQAVSITIFDDAIARNTLIDYASEQFEVAAYKALISVAHEFGFSRLVPLLQQNLEEDAAMARWLDTHLPLVVVESVRQSATRS